MTSYATSTVQKTSPRWARVALLSTATVLAAGCASVPNPSPNDPLESYNRGMFAVNEAVDNALFKPIANGYVALTPQPLRTCVGNIFNNLGDVWSAANSFLQARGHDFFNTLGRVMFNTTMGLGGCIDVASMNGSKRIVNDFGITLGVWGISSGPYIVLPILGASDLRDGTARLGTFAADFSALTPVFAIDNVPVRNSILGLYAVDTRANLLDADKLVDEIALDRYSFIRDAYLQRRDAQVNSRRNTDTQLPDYGDDELPDYSDPDAADTGTLPATPVANPAQ
ncbi:MAG: VacJ family lipoprotein [Burkholderiaceae bacterium]|nr:VacJ family lipoprotein [Burkholderiaceae bacterium]